MKRVRYYRLSKIYPDVLWISIIQSEAIWIKESSYSALIYAEKYEGEIHKYDVKSMYPAFMKSTTLKLQ